MSTETSVQAIVKVKPNSSPKDWKRRLKYDIDGTFARVFENVKTNEWVTTYEVYDETFVKDGNMLPKTDPDIIKSLVKAANKIVHCGDYCHLYWNPIEKIAWMTMGDGDCGEPFTEMDEIKDLLMNAGAKKVFVEAEHNPSIEDYFDNLDDAYADADEDGYEPSWKTYINYHSINGVKGIVKEF